MKTGTLRRGSRRGLAAVAAAALALGALVATPLGAAAAEVEVTDVTFDWGINNESSGGAYFGVCNFLSAGIAGDTGSSRVWSQNDGFLKAEEGNTRIVKPTADGTGTQLITWANRCLQPNGERLVQPTSNNAASYTQTRAQIVGGSGTVDVAANTADISWDGSFTVAYYGGMTYWSVTDPRLVVDSDGTGTLTGLVSGYGADMDDPEVWSELADRPGLTLANLTGVDVTSTGITVTPDYLGVSVPDEISGRNPAVTDQPWSGAFPADFLEFQVLTGQSSYWYTTAGGENSIQPRKAALPITVGYQAPAAVAITTPPSAQSVSLGQQATFSVVADDATGYQWQSAATGSDVWADVPDASSATLVVAGTSANAKQYRVVVSGAGGPVTSAPVGLTVAVPTPAVTVSKTTGLDPEGEVVTVTGSGFLANPPATSGARPPLAGVFSGAYIAFAKSVDGTLTNYTNALSDYTTWGVHASEIPAIGGTGTVIAADGTFTAQIRAEEFEIADGGTWGIRTYAAGGSGYAPFATFTPVAFAAPAQAVITTQPSAQSVTLGEQATFSVVADDATGYQWQSAATGSDVWADIPDASSATLVVAGTSANAKQYRVVVASAGGPVTSAAAALTVAVPVPTIVVSRTEGLDPEGESITVSGSGFLPNAPATSGVRPPLADQFTGAYVAFGRFADVWKPSAGVGRDARPSDPDATQWGVHAAQIPTIGGPSAATLEIQADGTFTTTFTVAKDYAGVPDTGNFGIYTYPGGGAAYPAFETFTPIAFAIPVPDAPAAPSVALGATDTSVDVAWTAPDDNGEAISGYDVTLTPATGAASTVAVAGDRSSTTFDGLVRGQSYSATVVAKNAGGSSPVSPASASVTIPAVAPSAPLEVSATAAGTSSVNVAWAAPATDGGAAVTGYTVSVSRAGEVVETVDVASTSATVTGLERATAYDVTVVAINAAGTSASSAVASVTTLAEVPASLAAPTVSAASGTALNVQWVAADDGGSPVTGYVVTVSGGGAVVAEVEVADVTTTTVDGLQNGTVYTVTVAAKNAAGTGAASAASAPVRTFSAPSAPVVTARLAGSDGVEASWPAPSDGGAAITGYTAQLITGGQVVQTATVVDPSVEFGQLAPGGVYTVSVTATNNVATSAAGVSDGVTVPAVAPGRPAAPVLAAGTDGTSITVGWTAPASDGGSAITGYTVTVVDQDEESVTQHVGADARSAVFAGLAAGEYRATVAAVNAVDTVTSQASAPVVLAGAAPAEAPAPVADSTFVDASGGDAKIVVDGEEVEILVGVEHAGTWVGVTVHSAPVFLGWFLVDAQGFVRTTLPTGLAAGVHHVVVQDAAGTVLGYQAFRVGDPPAAGGPAAPAPAGGLANTGTNGDALGWATFASLLLLSAGGVTLIARRRSARA